ncbi:MAG: HAMP domain-containing histidine kinase [Desulfobacter sp.]|nr:MAG: HAMP domain-containing histidine kinase [Desulfobacter sp.]
MKKIWFVCLLLMIAGIGAAHYVTPGHLILYHDTYRRLAYFPIVIGAILYGVKGGLAMAVLSCLSFVPHLFMFWFQGTQVYYSELSEILFYLAADLFIGMVSSRENKLRIRYQALSEQLASSYQRLHDQAGRLVQAEKELGQENKLSMLGHVSASLAHEIKNPLAAIKGAVEILADEVNLNHPKHEFIEIMRSEVSRLNNSVDEVLAYCRGQQKTREDKMVVLSQVVDRVSQVVGPKVSEKAIDLSWDRTMAEEVRIPENALTQVLINLLLNAADAVDKKGKIWVSHRLESKRLCIDIDDNGPGLDTTAHKTVFQPFVTFKAEGTGLGLSITQRILERLGGTIQVTRSEFGSACFSINLPVKKGPV